MIMKRIKNIVCFVNWMYDDNIFSSESYAYWTMRHLDI